MYKLKSCAVYGAAGPAVPADIRDISCRSHDAGYHFLTRKGAGIFNPAKVLPIVMKVIVRRHGGAVVENVNIKKSECFSKVQEATTIMKMNRGPPHQGLYRVLHSARIKAREDHEEPRQVLLIIEVLITSQNHQVPQATAGQLPVLGK